jgi:hypothetical protein
VTEHVRVIPTDGTSPLLDGDCGVVLSVLKACPDEPRRVLRCACGAEIVPRISSDEQRPPATPGWPKRENEDDNG